MIQNYCELCGKKTNKVYKAEVLGGIMYVCEDCLRYGKKIEEKETKIKNKKFNQSKKENKHTFKKKIHNQETEEAIIPNAVELIKKKLREENLNINTFSRAIGEKESTISKILNKKLNLDIETAKKIEKFFKINLIEEIKTNNFESENDDDEEFTIGDYINL